MSSSSHKRPMRTLVLLALLLVPGLAAAKVVNVEFKFTPFTGDTKEEAVETVPGRVKVSLNNVPVAEQEVRRDRLPVMFEEREIAPAAWVNVESLGPLVRKGDNTVRFEFEPATPGEYRAQLRWASVTDQVREQREPGRYQGTNQADEGVEEKTASGPLAMERKFKADFASDQPWHHLPPVTIVSNEDRQAIVARVQERADWFKPDFASVYKALAAAPNVDLAEIQKRKCVEAAHKAGARIGVAAPGEIDVVVTGGPEVVVRSKRGALYRPDESSFEKIKGEELQMCAGMALMAVYPPRLVMVRTPGGSWEVIR
jgi:hypothetical protein